MKKTKKTKILQSITVLPDSEPKRLKDGYKLYNGDEVMDLKGKIIKSKSLKKGRKVRVINAFKEKRLGVVQFLRKDGVVFADDTIRKQWHYKLVFDQDDRRCWNCVETIAMTKELYESLSGQKEMELL